MDPIIFIVERLEGVLISEGNNEGKIELRFIGYIEDINVRPIVNVIGQLDEKAKELGEIIISKKRGISFVRAYVKIETIEKIIRILSIKPEDCLDNMKIFLTPNESSDGAGKVKLEYIDFYIPLTDETENA